MEIHKDYEYIWHKYAEKDKSAAFRQRDQFIYLKYLTRSVLSYSFKSDQKWAI